MGRGDLGPSHQFLDVEIEAQRWLVTCLGSRNLEVAGLVFELQILLFFPYSLLSNGTIIWEVAEF